MGELIDQLASKAGIDDAVAGKTIGFMLGVLRGEGSSDKVQALIDEIAGAEATIAAASMGGGLGKLMGNGMVAGRHEADGCWLGHARNSEHLPCAF